MILNKNRKTQSVFHGQHAIVAIYKGAKIVWQKVINVIRSCFAKGYWINNESWTNDRGWKNN